MDYNILKKIRIEAEVIVIFIYLYENMEEKATDENFAR